MKSFLSSLSAQSRYLIYVILFNFFGLGVGGILIGSFLPMLRADYGLSYSFSGLLVSAFTLGNIATGLLTGFLPILFGRKRSYIALAMMAPIGFGLMLLTGQPLVLLLAFLAAGMARGGGANYGNAILNELSPNSSALLNAVNATFALGALLAPLLLLAFTSVSDHGWRLAVALVVVLGLLSALSACPMKLGEAPASAGSAVSFGFLRSRLFWITVALSFCYMSVESAVIGWMVSFFSDSGAASDSFSLLLNGLLWLSILIGRCLCGVLATRMSSSRLLLVLSCGMFLFFILLMSAHSLPVMIAATAGFGLSASGMYATGIGNAGSVFTQYPISLGFYTTFSGIGAIVSPSLVGAVADCFSLRVGMYLLFLPLIAQAVFAGINRMQCKQTHP